MWADPVPRTPTQASRAFGIAEIRNRSPDPLLQCGLSCPSNLLLYSINAEHSSPGANKTIGIVASRPPEFRLVSNDFRYVSHPHSTPRTQIEDGRRGSCCGGYDAVNGVLHEKKLALLNPVPPHLDRFSA